MKIDGIQLQEGSVVTNFTVASGTSFPSSPNEGELFFRSDSASTTKGLYAYIGGSWNRIGSSVSLTAPSGAALPSTANTGDLFYKDSNDGTEGLYAYNDSAWASVVSSGSITESQITDGSILARVADNETVSGNWTFNGTVTGQTPTLGGHLTTKDFADGAYVNNTSDTMTGTLSFSTSGTAVDTPNNGAGVGTKLTIQPGTGTGTAGTTGGNGHIELIGGGGTTTWTGFVGVSARRRGGILLRAGLSAGNSTPTYYHGSRIDISGSSGTNDGTNFGVGSNIVLSAGSSSGTLATPTGSTITLNGGVGSSTSGAGGGLTFNTGTGADSTGSQSTGATLTLEGGQSTGAGGSTTFVAGNASSGSNQSGGNITITAGNKDGSGTAGYIYLRPGSSSGTDTFALVRKTSGSGIGFGTLNPTSRLDIYTQDGSAPNGVNVRSSGTTVPLTMSIDSISDIPYVGVNTVETGGGNQTYDISSHAVKLRMGGGQFIFNYAASGTAGNTISWSEAMKIDTTGLVTANNGLAVTGAATFTGAVTAASFSGNVTGSASLNVLKAGDSMTGDLIITGAVLKLGSSTSVNGINSTTSVVNPKLQVTGVTTTTSSYLGARFAADGAGPLLMLGKSRGTSVGSFTTVVAGDNLGAVNFSGADGTAFAHAGTILAEADGTIATGSVPGRLVFSTTAVSATSPTERFRITSAGAWGLAGANYGTSGQVLTSNGTGSAVTWRTPNADVVQYQTNGTGSVLRTVEEKLDESLSPIDFGAAADGTTNDSTEFTAFEAVVSGQVVNLHGKTFAVTSYPTGNTYVNGKFVIAKSTTIDGATDSYNWTAGAGAKIGLPSSINILRDVSTGLSNRNYLLTQVLGLQGFAFDERNAKIYTLHVDGSPESSYISQYAQAGGTAARAASGVSNSNAQLGHQGLGLEYTESGAVKLWGSVRYDVTNFPNGHREVIRFSYGGNATNISSIESYTLFGSEFSYTGNSTMPTVSYCGRFLVAVGRKASRDFWIRVFDLPNLISGGAGDYSSKWLYQFNVDRDILLDDASGAFRPVQGIASDGASVYLFSGNSSLNSKRIDRYSLDGRLEQSNASVTVGLTEATADGTFYEPEGIALYKPNNSAPPCLVLCIVSAGGGAHKNRLWVVGYQALISEERETLVGGRWTPTATAVTNVAAATSFSSHYSRINNEIHFAGRINLDPTATGYCEVRLTLPITSDLTSLTDAVGTLTMIGVSGTTSTVDTGAIEGDTTNDALLLKWICTDTANRSFYFSGMAEVK